MMAKDAEVYKCMNTNTNTKSLALNTLDYSVKKKHKQISSRSKLHNAELKQSNLSFTWYPTPKRNPIQTNKQTTPSSTPDMSPFTQLQSTLGHVHNYGNGIDRDFSPLLHYIDEFDRHFSHRHRFVNCFIPRFDLEEDDGAYYLFGDLPGAGVEDITVEVSGEKTLVIFGKTGRIGGPGERQGSMGVDGNATGVTSDGNYGQISKQEEAIQLSSTQPSEDQPHHLRNTTAPGYNLSSDSNTNPNSNPNSDTYTTATAAIPHLPPRPHKILLSERLTGDFTRTFAFPSAVDEKRVRASMENGVLSLVVPKKPVSEEDKERGVNIPVLKGKWWKAENGLHGENEVSARGPRE
ncbi:hypothetical protein VTL71DRAFT_14716 [Oculimacula yallundae]|uniref:SHSP domain-containing protein n=1 Tax=Oculimacula yallundae TaxID=86028 RepID=A0ABR4CLD1_9HELO